MQNRYVFTGGPGSGKTTILTAIENLGYCVAPEAARRIIKERLSGGLPPRPQPATFAKQILDLDIQQYRKFEAAGPVLFDRSILDALYMLNTSGSLSKDLAVKYVKDFPYNEVAFFFPPWEEIYSTDSERDQTFEESRVVFEEMKHWYLQWGYTALEVPRVDIESRVHFVLENVGNP